MELFTYYRSTSSYRVRIALALKGLRAEDVFHHLRKGEQRSTEYLALNPQGLLPTLVLDDGTGPAPVSRRRARFSGPMRVDQRFEPRMTPEITQRWANT